MDTDKNNITGFIVSALWTNWAVAFGSIALTLILPLLIPHAWLALPVFLIAYAVQVISNRHDMGVMLNNVASLKVAATTLYLSSFIMLAIVVMQHFGIAEDVFKWSTGNQDIPYITAMVVFPCMCLASLWSMFTGYGQNLADEYRFKEGVTSGASVVASFITRANRYQVSVMLLISIGIICIDLWYYYSYYINVNMNTPDIFFYNWIPVLLYLASLYFMWVRYHTIASILGPIVGANAERGVLVRFLVVSGDRMLLTLNKNDRWDTPVSGYLPIADAQDENAVRALCAEQLDTDDFSLKYLYESGANDLSAIQLHYAAFQPDEVSHNSAADTKWFTLDQIDRMLRNANLSAEFTDELYRLFTITMAWKTYDKDGRRLYPIKKYRPTFRLRDMKNWTVDYDDPHWMFVAENNQDRPFFRTRRLWQKITGVRLK